MANYYTKGSFLVPIDDEFKVTIIEALPHFMDGELTEYARLVVNRTSIEGANIQERFIYEAVRNHPDYEASCEDDLCWDMTIKPDDVGIHIAHDESLDTDPVNAIIQAILFVTQSKEVVVYEYANTTDKPLLDGFGGGVNAVSADKIDWYCTSNIKSSFLGAIERKEKHYVVQKEGVVVVAIAPQDMIANDVIKSVFEDDSALMRLTCKEVDAFLSQQLRRVLATVNITNMEQ